MLPIGRFSAQHYIYTPLFSYGTTAGITGASMLPRSEIGAFSEDPDKRAIQHTMFL